MPIHWRDEMSVDGSAIDTDHKFLINLINELEGELETGFDQYRILDGLKRLEYYTIYHFSREESIQERIGFTHHREHVEQHRQLRLNVKGAIQLLQGSIPRSRQETVKKRIIDLLRLWIVGHIARYDLEMRPFFRHRLAPIGIKPMRKVEQGYQVPFHESGKALAVQVVATEHFVGLSFMGRAERTDSALVGKACEVINAFTTETIVASLQELKGFDEFFIGHILVLLGTFNESGRKTYLVTGGSGPCCERLHLLGIDKIIRTFPSNSHFYREVGLSHASAQRINSG